jgi:uncharacterized protein YqeY
MPGIMSTPQERLSDDVKAAMKAQDKERLGAQRMLLAAVKNEKIELGHDLDDAEFHAVVRRQIKQRRDSIEQFRAGNRIEMAEKEERELAVLEGYLPAQASEDAIRAAIAEVIAAEGLSGPKGLGPIMKAIKAKFGATADGSLVNRLAKEALGS